MKDKVLCKIRSGFCRHTVVGEYKAKVVHFGRVDEGHKRVMQSADDLFGGPRGSPRTDRLIATSIQWAEKIMTKIDERNNPDKLGYDENDQA